MNNLVIKKIAEIIRRSDESNYNYRYGQEFRTAESIVALPELQSAIEGKEKYDKLFSNLQAVETVKASLVAGTLTPAKAEQEIFRTLTEEEKEEYLNTIIGKVPRWNRSNFKLKSGIRVEEVKK